MSKVPDFVRQGRNTAYADHVASDIYARRGGIRSGVGIRRNVGWLTAKQTALLARNADSIPHRSGELIQGDLLNPDGDVCGVWEVSIARNGAGMLNVSLFSELPK